MTTPPGGYRAAEDDAVGHTISEDFTAGLIAEQSRNLRTVFNVTLQNYQVQRDGHALQDYQLQLMLLERQNRKRLEMAKAVDEYNNASVDLADRSGFDAANATIDRASSATISRPAGLNSRKRQRCSLQPVSSPTTPRTPDDRRLAYKIIYRIICAHAGPQSHPFRAYHDVPLEVSEYRHPHSNVDSRGALHLNGYEGITNLARFMHEDAKAFPFVVIRQVSCDRAHEMAEIMERDLWQSELFITSDILFRVIQSISKYAINTTFRFHENYGHSKERYDHSFAERRVDSTHLFLYHHRNRLAKLEPQDHATAGAVKVLLDFIDAVYGSDFQEADELFTKSMVNRKHIGKLFAPNDMILGQRFGMPVAAVLTDQNYFEVSSGKHISCWTWNPAGSAFNRRALNDQKMTDLPPEQENVTIWSLSVMPLAFAKPETLSLLRTQGHKQWEHRRTRHVSYSGWNATGEQFYPDARFIIDHQMYRSLHPKAPLFEASHLIDKTSRFDARPASLNDASDSALQSDPSLFLVFSPDTYGFYLNEKKWINIFIKGVQPPKWNKQAFERLVLPREKKDLVKALVTVRTSQQGIKQGLGIAGKREDLISGKGNGLIMLLHGGPGTGKSLTAESVAEIAEMPLYRVTCGDIGTNAAGVEKYLNGVFSLGKAWNCVLLLDEADVFLEERSMSDLERNSLVSVFLRSIEYYDGILILTSNRVGTFDEAFRSRIQVALHYEALSRVSRRKVWENFFDMLEEDEENADLGGLRERIGILADNEMNGRQIRNTLTTARQLAIYRKETLEWIHIEQALKVSTDFDAYCKRVQGHSDEDWARVGKIR